jgi:hypothetical protein
LQHGKTTNGTAHVSDERASGSSDASLLTPT